MREGVSVTVSWAGVMLQGCRVVGRGGCVRRGVLAAVILGAMAGRSAWAQVGAKAAGALISVGAVAVDDGTHTVFAVDQRAGTVVTMNDVEAGKGEASRRVVKVGEAPVALAVNPKTKRVYVANRASGTLSVLDEVTDKVVATISVGARPFAVAVDAVTNRVYVSNTFNDVMTIVDGATNVTSTLQAGGADAMLVPAAGGRVYLTGYEDTNLRVLDEATRSFSRLKTGSHNWGIAQNVRTGDVWAPLAGSGTVVVLAGGSGERTEIAVGAIPCAVTVDAATNRVYVVNYGDETLTVVDGATKKVIATVKVGSHPQAVAVDARRNRVYVANVHGGSVTEIDGATNTVVATRAAGKNPYALAVSDATGRVYVADMAGEPLTVLPAE